MIGDMGSIFVPPFLERIATYYSSSIFDVVSYRENRIGLVRNVSCSAIPRRSSLLNKIPKVRGVWALIQKQRYIAKAKPYDICHVHFIDKHSALLSRVLSRRCKNIVSSVWGSDFYRSSGSIRRVQERLYKISNVITFTNEKSMMEFDEYYDKRYSRKLRICRFGLAPLEVLRNLELSKKECRKSLGLPESSLIVTIGYNNSPAQQHIKILNSIEKTREKYRRMFFLFFP